MEFPKVYLYLSMCWTLGLLSLLLAVPFAAARYSLVAFFATLTAVVGGCLLMWQAFRRPAVWQMHYFRRQARSILANATSLSTPKLAEPERTDVWALPSPRSQANA